VQGSGRDGCSAAATRLPQTQLKPSRELYIDNEFHAAWG